MPTEKRIVTVPVTRLSSIPLATIVAAADFPTAVALNEAAEADPTIIPAMARYVDRVHSDSHTTSGKYNVWCGVKNMGTGTTTTLGEKLTAAGVATSMYGHGSYVMQARPEEAPDIETHYPLAIAVFHPGFPDDERTSELLAPYAETTSSGIPTGHFRDEIGAEGDLLNFWNFRAPADAVMAIVGTGETTPYSGDQCWAIRQGPVNTGQLVWSTGIQTGTVKAARNGTRVHGHFRLKAAATTRTMGIEIRWMNASFATIATYAGETHSVTAGGWVEFNCVADSPADDNVRWVALQGRRSGFPIPAGETLYMDDASLIETAGTLAIAMGSGDDTMFISSAENTRPKRLVTFTVDDDLVHLASHGLVDEQEVWFMGVNPPGGISKTDPYYVTVVDAGTFRVSLTTPEGSTTNIAGSPGTTYVSEVPPWWPYRGQRIIPDLYNDDGELLVAEHSQDPDPITTTTHSVSTAECIPWVRIDDEVIGVTSVVPGTGTNLVQPYDLVRGMWGTTPAAHAQGAPVLCPLYVGSINEGADATFAGSPAVNDALKPLRYVVALDQSRELAQPKRGTEWLAKRRAMQLVEYDRVGADAAIPSSSNPDEWDGVDLGPFSRSVRSLYLDITGTGFYNQADGFGFDTRPWSIVGVPDVIDAGSLHTFDSFAAVQAVKMDDFRAVFAESGLGPTWPIIANNLAAQANVQDPLKDGILISGTVTLGNFEFFLNKPDTAPLKMAAQRDQIMTLFRLDYPFAMWAKSGQNGLRDTPFDSDDDDVVTADELYHYRRWVYAHFLMGWRGSDRQQMVSEWGVGIPAALEPLFLVPLGAPSTAYTEWDDIPEYSAGVKVRAYARGLIYLNTTDSPVTVTLEVPLSDALDPDLAVVEEKAIDGYEVGVFVLPT